MLPRFRMHCLCAFAAMLTAMSAAPARADGVPSLPDNPDAASVSLQVQVIRASTTTGPTDPRLQPLQKRLAVLNFASFQQLTDDAVPLGKTARTVALPGNRRLEVARSERAGDATDKVRVHLRLVNDKQVRLLDADYVIKKGGDLLVGGPKLEDGTLLIFLRH